MRLRSLDLVRYGKFTDHTFDFGEGADGQPDFHIIYGPNEAGKSTAFAAFLDLLFGIEARSRYGFLHPYGTMRIGAQLELGGRLHTLRRIKRPQNSLLDEADRSVPEQLIQGCLGGITRETYRAMFSLNDETLEAGGETILASKGDLGELLFAATAGLADLSQTLVQVRAEAEGFCKPNARATILATLKAEIARLKEQRAAIDVAAAEYARLCEARDGAARAYSDALRARATIEARMNELQADAGALPLLATLHRLRGELAPLVALPEAPPEWLAALPALQETDTSLAVRLERATRDLAARTQAWQDMTVDEAALAIEADVEQWAELRARVTTAELDIPDREAEIVREDRAIAGLLVRLGQPDHCSPVDLILPGAQVEALRTLLEARSGLDVAAEAAQQETAEARRLLEEGQESTRAAGMQPLQEPPAAAKLASLEAALQALQGSDHATRQTLAEQSEANQQAEAAERLAALHPWQGSLDALAALSVPEAMEVAGWHAALDEAQKRHALHQQTCHRLDTEHMRQVAGRDSIAGSLAALGDDQAAGSRAAREAAWAHHRSRLDDTSAELFERALRRDDLLTDQRAQHQAEMALLREMEQAIALLRADAQAARRDLAEAAAHMSAVRREVAAAIAAMIPALPPDLAIPHLRAWLGKRDRALEIHSALKQATCTLREARSAAAAQRDRLAQALAAAGIACDPAAAVHDLVATAHAALAQAGTERQLRERIAERMGNLATREAAQARAVEAAAQWQLQWDALCASTWLGTLGAPPATGAVRDALDLLSRLAAALERRAALQGRVEDMRRHVATHGARMAAAAWAIGLQDDAGPPLELERRIMARVRAARESQERQTAALQALKDVRAEHHALQDEATLHQARCASMAGVLGATSLADMSARLHEITRRAELRAQSEEAECNIIQALRLPDIAACEARLDQADRAALEAELGQLKTQFDDQDARVRTLFAEHCKTLDRMASIGGDEAVATLEARRRTLLLQIEDGARHYLKLRLGVAAAEHALRAYRQSHRSAMMERASDSFRTMSRNAYTGLASQPKKDGEDLVALSAAGGSKLASDLSKGTRFQLYLALRVAGYYEFAAVQAPLPFVADDIMETFDDFRAEEALRLFAQMSRTGQVIYMTHHRHLFAIASQVCPGVRIHDLPA